MANNRLRAVQLLALAACAVLAACSSLVGADFDGLAPAVNTTGGTSSGGGGSGGSTSGGSTSGANQGGAQGQAGNAASGSGGAPTAGAGAGAGGPGGAAAGGTGVGGAGGTGVGGAGAGGAEVGGEGGMPGGGAGGEGATSPVGVVINELKGQGSGSDYIELYNPGPAAANLAGAYVGDDSANRITFPEGTLILANSYVLVRLQQPTTSGMETSCFGYSPCFDGTVWGIAAGGEVIFFHDRDGVLLDTMTYPNEMGPNGVENGQAYGRVPDGSETLGAITQSPGFANVAAN